MARRSGRPLSLSSRAEIRDHLFDVLIIGTRPGGWRGRRERSRVSDDSARREKAREVVQAGKLPNRQPDRMWGGPGVGAKCSICNVPVNRDETEFEIEFAQEGADARPQTHHVHSRCFAAWQLELPSLDGKGQ